MAAQEVETIIPLANFLFSVLFRPPPRKTGFPLGEFGEQRLIDLVWKNRDLPLQKICEIVTAAVDDWIGANEQPDDITLVLARGR